MNDICEEAIAYKEDPQYRNFINLYCKEIVTYQFEQGNYEEALSYYLMHAEFIEMILNDEFSVEELEFIVEIFDNIVICCDKLKQYSLKLKYAWSTNQENRGTFVCNQAWSSSNKYGYGCGIYLYECRQ